MRHIAGPSGGSDQGNTVMTYDGVSPAKVVLRIAVDYASKPDTELTVAASTLLAEAMSLDGGLRHAIRLLRAEAFRQENEEVS